MHLILDEKINLKIDFANENDIKLIKKLIEHKQDDLLNKILLGNDATIDLYQRKHYNLILDLINHEHQDIAQHLIKNINPKNHDKKGGTILHIACRKGDKEMIEFLLQNNFDHNQANNKGGTPLHIACSQNRANIVQYLLQKGCDHTIKNNTQLQPLHIACLYNQEDNVKLMLKMGIRIDLEDEKEQRFLEELCLKRGTNIGQILMNQYVEDHKEETDQKYQLFLKSCQNSQTILTELFLNYFLKEEELQDPNFCHILNKILYNCQSIDIQDLFCDKFSQYLDHIFDENDQLIMTKHNTTIKESTPHLYKYLELSMIKSRHPDLYPICQNPQPDTLQDVLENLSEDRRLNKSGFIANVLPRMLTNAPRDLKHFISLENTYIKEDKGMLVEMSATNAYSRLVAGIQYREKREAINPEKKGNTTSTRENSNKDNLTQNPATSIKTYHADIIYDSKTNGPTVPNFTIQI